MPKKPSVPTRDIKEKQMAVEEQAVVLATLAERVAHDGCKFLELGTWCGDSAMVLGEVAKKHHGHLFCVDWWKGNIGTDLENIAKERDIYSVFWERVRNSGLEDVIIPVRCKSEDMAGVLAQSVFDLIYIDADHRYESVRQDISNYALRTKVGGILCGDDCEGTPDDFTPDFLHAGRDVDYFETVHCGVVMAVGAAFPSCSIDYNIWSVQRTEDGWCGTNAKFPNIVKKRQFSPPLIESYKKHNLVRYGRSVFAIPQALGPIDISDASARTSPAIFHADSMLALRSMIDKLGASDADVPLPVMVKSTENSNIVFFNSKYYVIPKALGEVHLEREDISRQAGVHTTSSLEDAMKAADGN